MADFTTIASRLNHDIHALRSGQEIQTTIDVHSIDELRQLFHDSAPHETRAKRAHEMKTKFPELMNGHHASAQALLQRVKAYVLGDEPLPQADRERIRTLFPMQVRAVSQGSKTLNPGEVWDLGTSTSQVIVNLDTLTMESGSSIIIRNTVLK